MTVTVKLKYLRIAPRKVRLVADIIRGQKISEAEARLEFARKKAAEPLKKLLHSAAVSAENNFQLDKSNLFVSKIFVDEGPKLKRWRFGSRGSSSPIQKKTSHVTLILDTIEKELKPVKKRKRKKELKKAEEEKPKKEIKIIKKPKTRERIATRAPKVERGLKRIFRRKAF